MREARGEPESIAVVVGQLGQGGTERQLYHFLAHCDFVRWAPTVYVSGELGFWEAPIRKLGIPVVLLKGRPLEKMRQFRAACVAQKTRCLFSWSSYTNVFALALTGLGIRSIGSFRNALFADLPTGLRGLWSWMSVAGISTAVCNSRETQRQLAHRLGSKKRVVYVPNAVEIFPSDQMARWRADWRQQLDLRDDAVLVLGVGRLVPQKRFDRFIDTIESVGRHCTVQAVIAGQELGCLDALKSQVGRLGIDDRVRFLGSVPDARELICASDIFLLSSDYEGMPNVVLEAMAAGVPCVATRVNGVADLIQNGVTGVIAGSKQDDLSREVLRLATDADIRREIGTRARAWIEQKFQPKLVTGQLWTLCATGNDVDAKKWIGHATRHLR
ncbi:glycosyltransferase involved in cell wall biosynthesis [Mycoplana sp. BE70]|uniref:glycosyltransferase family 4 protein n=1 Tax=Mycoplana sp. BE70 TaxID=2817775 RepID=UPI00285DCA81|nr:glycosyltransferase family 4 protein [Mycoplana sp. BE70]MDR6756408.1 glycosyltransferase involved in cell wall biosynthesis [Mycoplana sp. BE70]